MADGVPAPPFEVRRDGFTISTDPARLDRDAVFRYLSEESYWAASIPRPVFERSLSASLCFGLYDEEGVQIGFGRVVSDFSRFAWLSDVYVLPDRRGRGLGRWLVATILGHPELQGLRRWMLATDDAHAIYTPHGFVAADPAIIMQRTQAQD